MQTMSRKVLVVDDDIQVRKILDAFLRFYGYDVECVTTGDEAITLIEKGHYDIVITDYMMPGTDGVTFTRMVRKLNLSLPIIGMSGSCNQKEFLSAGANFFINKPITLAILKDTLEQISLIKNS